MSAEVEGSFEAVAAKAAAGRADIGAGLNEVVVHRTGAVGATHLAAGPIAALSGCGALRRDPCRRGGTFSLRFDGRFVSLGRLKNHKRGE